MQGPDRGGTVEARERLLTPGEVASLFRVDPKTVTRWAAAGRISSIRTPGGHRRFREYEARALLRGALPAGPAPPQSAEGEHAAHSWQRRPGGPLTRGPPRGGGAVAPGV